MIRGAKNLQFYSGRQDFGKKVMTLPLLRIFGHNLASSNWTENSKSVVWTAACVAFFGSFRFGELLPKKDDSFNCFETLLWSDIRILNDGSVLIRNKIPKTRTAGGEFISLFEFNAFNCCPIKGNVSVPHTLKKHSNSIWLNILNMEWVRGGAVGECRRHIFGYFIQCNVYRPMEI